MTLEEELKAEMAAPFHPDGGRVEFAPVLLGVVVARVMSVLERRRARQAGEPRP
jgi:hypothetical protein